LGHYANKGFLNPLGSKKADKIFITLEITDYSTVTRLNSSKVISDVLDYILPHPIRFKRVWHFSRGENSMFAWQPVAPDNFVALGMVCTNTGILYKRNM
jgi:hypothetical protein